MQHLEEVVDFRVEASRADLAGLVQERHREQLARGSGIGPGLDFGLVDDTGLDGPFVLEGRYTLNRVDVGMTLRTRCEFVNSVLCKRDVGGGKAYGATGALGACPPPVIPPPGAPPLPPTLPEASARCGGGAGLFP